MAFRGGGGDHKGHPYLIEHPTDLKRYVAKVPMRFRNRPAAWLEALCIRVFLVSGLAVP